MPLPPIGDITCAASPISNKPGRYHRGRRSDSTASNEHCFQSCSSCTRLRSHGTFEETLSESNLIQDLHDCGMYRVATELAIEVGVRLEERDRNALAGQE